MRSWTPLPKVSAESGGLDPLVWKITAVAVLGSFLAQLDATVVNVSLSSLAVDLHSSLTAIQWVTSGYLLALALMLPLNGWLVERIGAKSLYLWCFSMTSGGKTKSTLSNEPVRQCTSIIGVLFVCPRSLRAQ
jgi:MFS family permease